MSIPQPSNTAPIVGGTPVLSSSEYSNFASERQAALANFQQSDISEDDDINGQVKGGPSNIVQKDEENGLFVLKPLPPILSNAITDENYYKPYYRTSYYTGDDVYTPYTGIPAPINKDYAYEKTVVTPDDNVHYVYKNTRSDKESSYKFTVPTQCERRCPTYFSPVCGTDNMTYQNQCHLDEMQCKTKGKVGFQYPGYCMNGFNKKQFIDYEGKGYNVVDTSYTTMDGDHYVYVIDGNLNTVVKKVNY
jgi:hypothetical protein